MMPVALIACAQVGRGRLREQRRGASEHRFRRDLLWPAAAGGIREYLLAHAGGCAAQAICHQRAADASSATRQPSGPFRSSVIGGMRFSKSCFGSDAIVSSPSTTLRPAVDDIRRSHPEKKRPVTDAKEVGVGNPAGRNVLSPDCSQHASGSLMSQPVAWHSLTIFCGCRSQGDCAGAHSRPA